MSQFIKKSKSADAGNFIEKMKMLETLSRSDGICGNKQLMFQVKDCSDLPDLQIIQVY